MIYHKNLLVIRILFENVSKRKIFGMYRPSAYMKESSNYCTTCRMDIVNNEIEPGGHVVTTAILEAPVGFGKFLNPGSVLSIRNGLDEEGRALIVEILGYADEITNIARE